MDSAIILYDWKKIAKASRNNPKRVVLALRTMIGEVPRNRFDPLYYFYCKDFSGSSFLVNPRELLANDYFYKPVEIAEYVALASYRNYSLYAAFGETSLDLLHSPVGQDIIIKNRLLSIKDDKILFRYEEVTKENI